MEALIFWAVLLGGPISALAAIVVARERGQSSWFNAGCVIVPPALFLATAILADTQDSGLGIALWPVVVGLIASFALAAKVFAVDRLPGVEARKTSAAWFAALSLAAIGFAVVAPIWHE
jgi:hypothetical protein